MSPGRKNPTYPHALRMRFGIGNDGKRRCGNLGRVGVYVEVAGGEGCG